MPIVVDNNFTHDSHGMRAERLNAIQANLTTIQPELNAPANIVTWAVDCYTVYNNKWTEAGVEAGEKEGQTIEVEACSETMEMEYQNARNLAISLYRDDPERYKQFGFDDAYPDRRNDQINRVDKVLKVNARHVVEMITYVIPAVVITRLSDAMTAFQTALNVQDKERAESEYATAMLSKLFETDTGILTELRSWWFAMMGKEDARIDYIGMVNPKKRGGGYPDAPTNLNWTEATNMFAWNAVDGATSYQLAFKLTIDNEWIDAYSGPNTSIAYNPGDGIWEFKVRARNANGFGDWSDIIEIQLPNSLLPPSNVAVVHETTPIGRNVISFDVPVGATLIDVFVSIVPLGNLEGMYNLDGTFPAVSPIERPVGSGLRFWYYLIGKNGTQSSLESTHVYVDVS